MYVKVPTPRMVDQAFGEELGGIYERSHGFQLAEEEERQDVLTVRRGSKS